MLSIVIDVHRCFAQVVILDSGKFTDNMRIDLEHDAVVAFGKSLRSEDEVVLKSTRRNQKRHDGENATSR